MSSEVYMDRIIEAVEQIRSLPESRIDVGIGQGHETFLTQMHRSLPHPQFCPSPVVGNEDIANFREALAEVQAWIAPNQLPSDYYLFLEYYGGFDTGGFQTDGGDYRLGTLGIGPMVEEWYGYIAGDDGLYEGGLLEIAGLSFDRESGEFDYAYFFLDLAGVIYRYGVIGLQWWKVRGLGLQPVLRDPHAHPMCWTKIADSFTEWLEKAADTAGTFGYVQRQEE
jgi:hypothetical protein